MGDTGSMSFRNYFGNNCHVNQYFNLSSFNSINIYFRILFSNNPNAFLRNSEKVKRIFISTPLHHHFEAIGWPESKIVMRFWLFIRNFNCF